MPRLVVLFRRSPHVVCYWGGAGLVFHNYATGRRVTAAPVAFEILDFFGDWRSAESLASEMKQFSRASVVRTVADLVSRTLLQRSDRRADPRERAMEQWSSWNPAAGLLHFSTKDVAYKDGAARADEFLRRRLRERRIPSPIKRYRGVPSVPLPAVGANDPLSQVLLARRTWRRFSKKPLDLPALSTLLGLTFGIHGWIDLGALGRAPLKTSPSGGARHPIEGYVVARRVTGLEPGLYYYAPDRHRLERLRRGASSRTIAAYLPGQPFYGSAAALVLMTAVFSRTEWQYPYARSYRAVLMEAGHVCQTFCLVATSLGLAPFCTDALSDSRIERDLRVDGVSESVLYAAGIGARPPGVAWAPWPDSSESGVARRIRIRAR